MTYLQAAILGAVQGLTEFLPVSSSGHLVLGQTLLGIKTESITFDIFVHFGTLLAVFIVFRARIAALLVGILRDTRAVAQGTISPAEALRQSPSTRLGVAVVIGTVPAVVVGFAFKESIEGLFASVNSVLAALAVTGLLLLCTFVVRRGSRSVGPLVGLLIGAAQALAIVPGISRSGSTISTGLFSGVDREEAGVFSFLLAIPAVLGATLLEVGDLIGQGNLGQVAWGPILLGTAAAFLSGWGALVLLMRVVRSGRIGWFGLYCLMVAAIGGLLL